jgi:NAD(P)-dependent dehydrogenase (short-subunit alcohol dehydrogenase family)
MDLGLDGRIAVVTGAGSGIGLATTVALAAEGVYVIAGDIKTESLEQLAGSVEAVQVDLLHSNGPASLIAAARERHGRIDILVNVLGGAIHRSSFLEVSDEDWREVWELNFLSTVRACRAVLPLMVEQGRGSIVSVASDAGRQPDPFFIDYCAAKASVISLSKSLSIEFGPAGVRSNVVTPGATRTAGLVEFFDKSAAPDWGMETEEAIEHFAKDIRRMPLGHLGAPEDVAAAIVFLSSDAARQVTGSDYRIDGGAQVAA